MAPWVRPKTRIWANWVGSVTAWAARRPMSGLLAGLWATRLAGLGEVELRLPDEARVLGVLATDSGGLCDCVCAQATLDHIDRHDLEACVAILVEVVGADHALEALDVRERVANLLARRRVAAVGLDGVAHGKHQRVGRVIGLHGVAAEVIGSGELRPELRDRVRGARNLRGVGAGGGRVDVRLVAGGLVDAVRRLDTGTATEWNVPSDVLHLLARNADVLVVSAADVDGLRAGVLEAEQDRLEVAGLLLLVFRVLRHGAAELLELLLERAGDANAEDRAVGEDADVGDGELLVHVVGHRRTLVVVSGDDAPVVVRVPRAEVLRVVRASRDVLGEARVRARWADHDEALGRRDRNLRLRDCGVVRSDHAQVLVVVQHLADVVNAGVGVVRALATVVEALIRDREPFDAAGRVLLVDSKLDAV